MLATPTTSGRKLAAAAAEEYSCEFGSSTYYAYCGLGGLLSCGITHTMVTPLDLVKCRLQVIKQLLCSIISDGFVVGQDANLNFISCLCIYQS